jgi:hypothetical protein
VRRDIPTLLYEFETITGAMQYQGWDLDRRQDVADVGLLHGPVARDRIPRTCRQSEEPPEGPHQTLVVCQRW